MKVKIIYRFPVMFEKTTEIEIPNNENPHDWIIDNLSNIIEEDNKNEDYFEIIDTFGGTLEEIYY